MNNQTKKYISTNIAEIIKKPIIYVLIICFFAEIIIYSYIPSNIVMPDSKTYIEEYTQNILMGELNESRTPVYPYFVKVVKHLTNSKEEDLYNNIVLIQKMIFFVSIVIFYYTVKKLTNNKIITIIFAIIYGVCPYIIFWNVMILTESLAIVEMTLLSFLTISYLKSKKNWKSIAINILILLMIFTRPSYIYLLPIFLVFWLLQLIKKDNRKIAIIGLISCIFCSIILGLYCFGMKLQYGKFSITKVSFTNNAITVIYSGTYKYCKDDEIINIIETARNGRTDEPSCWDALNELEKKYNEEELENFVTTSIKNDSEFKFLYIKKALDLSTKTIGTTKYVTDESIYANIAFAMIPVNFAMVYIVLIVSFLFLLYMNIKIREVDWYIAFFSMLILANLYTLIVGAPFEPQRLFASSIILIILQVAYVLGNEYKKQVGKVKK